MWGIFSLADVINDKRAETKFVIGNTFTIIEKNGQLKTLYSGTKENPLAFIEARSRWEDLNFGSPVMDL